jgi:threonine/homoserine/homoserine lactone efflux protein
MINTKDFLSFLGLFTSRHTAGTEFAIGPLFVARGSSAIDILVGLFIGNFLATLSWRFVVAPLAVSQRLTAYYAMERVVGRKLIMVFDSLTFILLAGLAGAMFTVSATAFAAMFNVDSPELTDMLPSSGMFCGIVIACGLVTTIVAALGFTFVTVFGQIMTPVLLAGIIYLCYNSLKMLGVGKDGCDLWCTLNEQVYTGTIVQGQTRFGMAHCIFFAWFVDLQLHIGQNDLSLL